MTTASGGDFDVFVSYARVDNEPIWPAKHGWVTVLIENLSRYLAKKIGRREGFQNWYDEEQLKGNHGIREHIPAQVRRSRLFLAVLSPGYVASDFCQLELKSFIETHKGSLEDRLFVIEHEPLADRQNVPEPFRDVRGYRFYALDDKKTPRTFAMPEPRTDEREYFQRIEDLARDIAAKLATEKAPKPTGPSVFLADVTDDLEPRRIEVRRYLDQAGLNILPASAYRLDRQAFERAMTDDLAKSAVFVQLLGEMAGKCPPDVPDGYNWLQHEIAKRASLPILQWRDPDLNPSKLELPLQRRLLELETVKAMPFEDFKRSIVDQYKKVTAPPPPPPPPPPGHSVIFINADKVDADNANAIRDSLGERFGWSLPLALTDSDALPEELQKDMEENLINSEGMFIVYGAARPAWVNSQIQQYRKLAPRSSLRLLAVVKAPPSGQKPLSIGLPGLLTIEIDRVAEIANRLLS
jgi:hypothetical protein